jgi:hypothetical protein
MAVAACHAGAPKARSLRMLDARRKGSSGAVYWREARACGELGALGSSGESHRRIPPCPLGCMSPRGAIILWRGAMIERVPAH